MCGFLCIFRAFLVCVFCPVVSTFPCPVPPPFFTAFALPYLSFLCIRLLTHALYFPCVPFIPVPLPLCRPFCPSYSPSLGFPFPLMRVFSLVAPTFPVLFPLFPVAFPSSSSFVPAFSVPCSPLFPLLRFPFRKKFSLKSCMISSVKYMFYSIFLACLGKFS